MAIDTTDTADKIAMILGGGLILLGTTVSGIIESFFTEHTLEPNGSLGDVVIHTSISPTFRAYTIALGFVVLFLYALYRLANRRLTEPAG